MPFGGPQVEAFLALKTVDVVGYGGAGGGGKTDLALGAAFHLFRKAILYRRTIPQLAGVEDRSREIYRRVGKYNSQAKKWTLTRRHSITGKKLPRPVACSVQFASMQYLEDREKARGNARDLMVFDEAQNFLWGQVSFVTAWNRTSIPGQHCAVLLTFNPPATPEGLWLLDYFAPWVKKDHPSPAAPGEVRWFITTPEGKDEEVPDSSPVVMGDRTLTPKSRTFFPARVNDNPVYRDSGYLATLDALPEPLRSQMRDGDMEAGLKDDAWQVIPTSWIRAAQKRWREAGGAKGWPTDDKGQRLPLTGLGGDISAGGDDETVFAGRVGDWFAPMQVHRGSDVPDGNAAAALMLKARGDANVRPNLDVIGIGQGIVTALNAHEVKFSGINSGSASYGRAKASDLAFANLRAEMWWRLREALDPENKDGRVLYLPDDTMLLQELATPRWFLSSQGIQLEPKDEIIKRLSPTRSPDRADALVLAHYTAPVAGYGPGLGRR